MSETFEKALDNAQIGKGSGAQEIRGMTNGHDVTAEVVESGSIGLRVRELTVAREGSLKSSHETAERLVDCITYLDEPLAILEFDPEENVAQVRSTPPQSRDGQPEYYELNVAPDRQTLTRFRGGSGPREQVPFDVTRHVLRRLVRDITGA